jgi:hypothetical protein
VNRFGCGAGEKHKVCSTGNLTHTLFTASQYASHYTERGVLGVKVNKNKKKDYTNSGTKRVLLGLGRKSMKV